MFEVHVLRMTRANRCFNDLQEDYLKCNWQARELDEFVSAYKVHTCHAYMYIYSWICIMIVMYRFIAAFVLKWKYM
jgi:hypothetical protein